MSVATVLLIYVSGIFVFSAICSGLFKYFNEDMMLSFFASSMAGLLWPGIIIFAPVYFCLFVPFWVGRWLADSLFNAGEG